MLMMRRAFLSPLLVAALGTGLGCGGGGGSPAAPTSGAPAASSSPSQSLLALDGDWRGTSAQGGAISFAVRNARVVSLTTEWSGQGPGGSCSRTSQHSMDVQIFTGGSTLGRFTHTQHDLSFFQGIFNSSSSAAGQFTEVIRLPSGATCSSGTVTWTASK